MGKRKSKQPEAQQKPKPVAAEVKKTPQEDAVSSNSMLPEELPVSEPSPNDAVVKDLAAEDKATEFDLPPRAFVFFLLAQRADNKIAESMMFLKLRGYLSNLDSGRSRDAAIQEIRLFLGSISSIAQLLNSEVR